jgi:hypothetical protein
MVIPTLKSLTATPWYTPALVVFLTTDVPGQLGISPTEFSRDVNTLEKRLADEGESFLTKTLPALGKAIDLALQGSTPLKTTSFKRRKRSSALPAFLQGLLKRVFLDTGYVRIDPCITSIRLLRQITYWCKKIEKGFSDESLQQATDKFINTDRSLPPVDFVFTGGTLGTAKALVDILFKQMPKMDCLRPKHGPGAVAGGEGVVDKRMFGHCYEKLEAVFRPYSFFYSFRELSENYEVVTSRTRCEYGLSRTTFVEKDSSGPRTIGLEPAEYMWAQQAVKGMLYEHLESHKLTKGRVNFTDQSINRNLTDLWADYDTLDMSSASDRNSYALVKALFKDTWIWPYLDASRTPGTVLPNGEVLWYKKFAPMGSATCFPVEAITFFVLAVACLHAQGMPLLLALKRTYVYGDDIIVPHGYFDALKETFESYYLLFNESKCCTAGKFRESCGRDAYDGVEVTPIRLRKPYPKRGHVDLIPLIEHANSLMKAGYWETARCYRGLVEQKFLSGTKFDIPTHDEDLPILHWLDFELRSTLKVHTNRYGMSKIRGWVYIPKVECSTAVSEERFLYESLSRGGPVGTLLSRGSNRVRAFSLKYRGRLKKRKIPFFR